MDWSECFQTGSRKAVHWDSTGKPPAKPPLVNHTSLCSVNKKTTNHHWLHQRTFVFEGEDRTSKYFHTGVVSRGTGVGGKTPRGTAEPHGCSAPPAHTALECYPSHTRNPPHQLRSTQNRKEGSVLIITCVISRWVLIALSDSDILWVFPLNNCLKYKERFSSAVTRIHLVTCHNGKVDSTQFLNHKNVTFKTAYQNTKGKKMK